MESTDELIHSLYRTAIEEEWQDYRTRSLARVCERFGASSAAWWSRGTGTSGGELTQHPVPHVTAQLMAALPFFGSAYAMRLGTIACMYAIMAVSWSAASGRCRWAGGTRRTFP